MPQARLDHLVQTLEVPLMGEQCPEMMSSDTLPLVSVIIPAYNAEPFIAKALASVLAQTYKRFEVIVVDDGSQDNTAAIVRQHQQQDERIKLFAQSNSGVAAARNFGIERSSGDFIAPLDADDLWYSHHLCHQVACFLASPSSVGLVYSWTLDVDTQDRLIGGMRAAEIEGNVYTTLLCHNFLGNASASMIRRSCLEKVGGYDTTLRDREAQGCEDWDLYLRIAEKFEFRAVPTLSVGYRKLSGSMSCDLDQMSRSHKLVMHSVRRRHPELNEWLFRLSSSNLYFYFARQSEIYGDISRALKWLSKAILAEPITCLIRIDLYHLIFKALFRFRIKPRRTVHAQACRLHKIQLAEIPKAHTRIAWIVALGNLYHWTVSRFSSYSLSGHPSLNEQAKG